MVESTGIGAGCSGSGKPREVWAGEPTGGGSSGGPLLSGVVVSLEAELCGASIPSELIGRISLPTRIDPAS